MQIRAIELNRPGARLQQPQNAPGERCLAAAGFSHQCESLAGVYRKIYPIDGSKQWTIGSASAGEVLPQAFHLEQWRHFYILTRFYARCPMKLGYHLGGREGLVAEGFHHGAARCEGASGKLLARGRRRPRNSTKGALDTAVLQVREGVQKGPGIRMTRLCKDF